MQHNNWNAFLQTITARNRSFVGKRLMVLSGTVPDFALAQTEAEITALVSSHLTDWVATYDTNTVVKIVNPLQADSAQKLDEAQGGIATWGSSNQHLFTMDFDESDSRVSTFIEPDTSHAQNSELALDSVTMPTWFVLADGSGDAQGCSLTDNTIFLVGAISSPSTLVDGSLMYLRSDPLMGEAPTPFSLGSLQLPIT
jgi:hypothetical protein